jgi:ubiquinone/menaquinone biosynthesis C-methylase UbiE
MHLGYSVENAYKFAWASVTGDLNPDRVAHLQKYLVGRRILDAGCGGGAYVEFLAAQGLDVTGFDKHEMFLKIATRQERRGQYTQGDVTELDLADKSFDCTYCFDVLEHVDDGRAMHELARVTRDRVIVAVPREDDTLFRYNVTFAHHRDTTHLRNYTEDSLRALCMSVRPRTVTLFHELPVHSRDLVESLFLSRAPLLNRSIFGRMRRAAFRYLLEEMPSPPVYTGLVAVVDL